MIFAIQSSVTGTFSWQSYQSHKKWSLAMTVATAGVGSYLTKGAAAGRAAAFGFQGKAGLALLWAASKNWPGFHEYDHPLEQDDGSTTNIKVNEFNCALKVAGGTRMPTAAGVRMGKQKFMMVQHDAEV